MPNRIRLRRGTAAEWSAENPTLALAEPGWTSDTGVIKVGDGSTPWNSLDEFASGPGGGASTGDVFFIPASALVVNGTAGEATTNTAYIQDKLDNYTTVVLPKSGTVTDAFEVDSTILLNSANVLIGQGKFATILRQRSGANLDAVVASKNWYNNTGAPSSDGRSIRVENIGVDGQYLNRTTGTVLQTSGLGHGIALATYEGSVHHCGVQNTRGHGILIDTTGKDGTTGLGEGVENTIDKCRISRAGLSGIHIADTAAVSGGITDGTLLGNWIAHANQRGSTTGDEGHGVFIATGGGWYVAGNHVYGAVTQGGQWAGYGASLLRDGIYVKSASGLRLEGNQVADFGYVSGTNTVYGIHVQGEDGDRGLIIAGNTVFTDEDNASNTYYAIRVTTVSAATDVGTVISNNVCESRATTPTLRGILLDGASNGTHIATVSGNVLVNVTNANAFGGNALDVSTVNVFGNSWQGTTELLGAATAAVTVSDTVTETTLFTQTVPADTLRPGDRLLLEIPVRVLNTTNTTTLTWRFKLGASTLLTSQAVSFGTNANPSHGRITFDVTSLTASTQSAFASVVFGSTATSGNMSALNATRTSYGSVDGAVSTESDVAIAVTVEASQAVDIDVIAAAATLTLSRAGGV